MGLRYPKMRHLIAEGTYIELAPPMKEYYGAYMKDAIRLVPYETFLEIAIFLEQNLHRPFRRLAVKKALQYEEEEKGNKDPAPQDLPKNKKEVSLCQN